MVVIAEVSSKKSICTFVISINDDHYNFGKESFWMKRRYIRHVISYATNEVLLQMKEITIIKHNKLSFLLVPIIRVIFLFWGHDSSKWFLYCLFQAIFGVLWLRKKNDDRLLFKQNFHESNVLNCGCSKISTDNTCPYSALIVTKMIHFHTTRHCQNQIIIKIELGQKLWNTSLTLWKSEIPYV